MSTICQNCNHPSHKPGECANCNCGASDISHGDASEGDREIVIEEQDFKRGDVAWRYVSRVKSRPTGQD